MSDIDYCSDTELNQKYKADVKENGKYDYIVVKMNLNNESDTNYNLINLISKQILLYIRRDMKIRVILLGMI